MRRGILASAEQFGQLNGLLGQPPYDAIYDVLQKRCNLIMDTAPVTESQWRSSWNGGQWGSALQAARTAQGRMFDLLIAHAIDRNRAYRDRAVEELKELIGWSTWLDPCHANGIAADLCTGESALAVVVAMDWLWEDLPAELRLRGIESLRDKAIKPYLQDVRDGAFWYECYHNWNAVLNGGVGTAAVALAGELSEAAQAAEKAQAGLRHVFDALGPEGGWDEGTGYWGYGMRYLLLYGQARANLLDDQKVFHATGMDRTGEFPVYFTPNGQAASFGDAASVPLYGALYLLARYHHCPELVWWLDTYSYHRDVRTSGWSAAGLAMLFRPADADASPAGLKPVKTFSRIGWGAMADHWPQPGLHVAVKTGDLAANHSHHDMNALQVQVNGEALLTDAGTPRYSREYFSAGRNEFYAVQARAHCTATLGENDHMIDAQGRLIEDRCTDTCRYLLADGGDALGEGVKFYRHVLMPRALAEEPGDLLIVLDEITSAAPERLDVFWHSRGKIAADEANLTAQIIGQRGALNAAFAGSSTLAMTLDRQGDQRYIRLTGGAIDRTLVLSVFSRRSIARPVTLHSEGEEVTLRAAWAEARFTARPDRLHFAWAKGK